MKMEPGSKVTKGSDSSCSAQLDVWNSLTKVTQMLKFTCITAVLGHPAQEIPKLKMVMRNTLVKRIMYVCPVVDVPEPSMCSSALHRTDDVPFLVMLTVSVAGQSKRLSCLNSWIEIPSS